MARHAFSEFVESISRARHCPVLILAVNSLESCQSYSAPEASFSGCGLEVSAVQRSVRL